MASTETEIVQAKDGRWYFHDIDPSKPIGDPDRIQSWSGSFWSTQAAAQAAAEARRFGTEPPPPPPPPAETKPILVASSMRQDYGGRPGHLYLNLNGVMPNGVQPPDEWPLLVDLEPYTTGMAKTDKALWPDIAAKKWDTNIRAFARKTKIMTLFHECHGGQGPAPDMVAAFDHIYDIAHDENPGILVGTAYFGDWAMGEKLQALPQWLPRKIDFLGCDRYPLASGKTFDELLDPWFKLARTLGTKLAVCETGASAGHAAAFYASIEATAHADELLLVALWLSRGDRDDYRPDTLSGADADALAALLVSPVFGREVPA